MTTSNTRASAASEARDGEAIFHEGRHLGFIVTRANGFDAVTSRGVALGRYNEAGAAARALLARSVSSVDRMCG